MTLRKAAGLLVAAGLMLGLIGAGVSASFSDSATATTTIHVGTFAIQITAATPGAVIAGDGKSVTYACPDILSSAAGSCPFSFTVKDVGTIDATVSVAAVVSGDGAQFSDVLGAVSGLSIPAGTSHAFNGGLQWTALGNGNLGQIVTVTYTVSASA